MAERKARTAPASPADATNPVLYDLTLLTDQDLYLFNEGTHARLYEKLGSHLLTHNGQQGAYFAVWAPDAELVSVIGDFNGWNRDSHLLHPRGHSGIWEGFIPSVGKGDCYKYLIRSRFQGYSAEKADPFGNYYETPPHTATRIWDQDYAWDDAVWMAERKAHNDRKAPISIYEVHLGSWRRVPEEDNRPLTYRELADALGDYLVQMGFTHVEFMPIMEHPFYGSWGYQTTGYFAPTSRYGTPEDLMYLIDRLHQRGIGVIMDWVPSHFPTDEFALGYFDGTHLYEHSSPEKGFHPDWKSFIFNYNRHEVRSFLLSSAIYWLDHFHADGLRVDAVASMLYLDYSRKAGEWMPNVFGGRENLEAIDFLRTLNQQVYAAFPDVQTIAEESTAWPSVSKPTYLGGLGFGFKWDMGWMHDTLDYMSKEPVYRRFHQDQITFRMIYAFHENFVLPLSHDEVVHGKGSLLAKMPGDDWQKFANLRLLFGYMYGQPGKKLLFMGGEFGQWNEWRHESSLQWDLTQYERHHGVQQWVAALNQCYRNERALHELDTEPAGYEWIDASDAASSIMSFLRKGSDGADQVLVVCNFTPVARTDYRIGVPEGGYWRELLNSDAAEYWGSGQGNGGGVTADAVRTHGRPYSLSLTLPPLSVLFLKRQA